MPNTYELYSGSFEEVLIDTALVNYDFKGLVNIIIRTSIRNIVICVNPKDRFNSFDCFQNVYYELTRGLREKINEIIIIPSLQTNIDDLKEYFIEELNTRIVYPFVNELGIENIAIIVNTDEISFYECFPMHGEFTIFNHSNIKKLKIA